MSNKESLLVLGRSLEYTVRTSERAHRMRVAVYADGDVVVTKPQDATDAAVKKFVDLKKLWIQQKLESAHNSPIPELRTNSAEHFAAHQAEAQELVARLTKMWGERMGSDYGEVTVRRMKSRWGSCSPAKNLSFNYKIVFLPRKIQQYVVVHELCHLRVPDHSQKFWGLVARTLPDYEDLNKYIREVL